MQIRFYARQSSRRTVTDEQQQQGTRQTGLYREEEETKYRPSQRGSAYEGEEPEDPEETTESTLTHDVRMHLSKVYGTMMAAIGLSSIGVISAGLLGPMFSTLCMVGGFVGSLGVFFLGREKVTLRQNLFMAVGFMMGAGIAPLVLTSSPGVVFAALLGTSSIFGGFSLAALKAKRKSMLYLGGVLGGGLMVVLAASLASIFLPMLGVTSPAFLGALYNINIYGGLALFSLFIAYDTQQMIEAYKAGDTDHITPALNMFINLLSIFIRLLAIFRGDK